MSRIIRGYVFINFSTLLLFLFSLVYALVAI